MSSSTRLQFANAELVRTRKLHAIAFAAGQSILYGATCPSRDVTIATTGASKYVRLRIHNPRAPWLFFAFTKVSTTSAPAVALKSWTAGGLGTVTTLAGSITSWSGGLHVHRCDMRAGTTPLHDEIDWMIGLEFSGTATHVIRDVIVLGAPTSAFPPFAKITPDTTS